MTSLFLVSIGVVIIGSVDVSISLDEVAEADICALLRAAGVEFDEELRWSLSTVVSEFKSVVVVEHCLSLISLFNFFFLRFSLSLLFLFVFFVVGVLSSTEVKSTTVADCECCSKDGLPGELTFDLLP